MNHDDNVCSGGQREAVARLLVSAIPTIHGMGLDLHSWQSASDRDGIVVTGVVDHNDKIDYALVHNFVVRLPQSSRCVVGRHDHDDFLTLEHVILLRRCGRGEPPITKVWRRDELYQGPAVDQAPDLIIDWRDGGYMPNDRDRGETAVFAPRFRQYMSWPTSGSHRLDGVLIAAGPDIEPGTRVHGARLIDILPTWLQLLGQPLPRELEGKPIYSLLERRKAS